MGKLPTRGSREVRPAGSPSPEEKWAANRAKVAFAEAFPGRLTRWSDAVGKTVDAVLDAGGTHVVVFSDGTFLITPEPALGPVVVLAALAAARPRLEPRHAEAFTTLDRLAARDRELTRRSKLDKILGAIRHNAADMPELKAAVQRLLDEWTDPPNAHG